MFISWLAMSGLINVRCTKYKQSEHMFIIWLVALADGRGGGWRKGRTHYA